MAVQAPLTACRMQDERIVHENIYARINICMGSLIVA